MDQNIFNDLIVNTDLKPENIIRADGIIKETKQGRVGDCWLLAALNSMSYCPIGQKLIKDSIKKNIDGSIEVYFKGAHLGYTISKDELLKARNNSLLSKGDDNILIFELAIEKYRKDITKKKFNFASDTPFYINHTRYNWFISKIDGGYPAQIFYLLSGAICYHAETPVQIETLFQKFNKNSEAGVLCIWFFYDTNNSAFNTKDINGFDVIIQKNHVYSIKKIKKNSIIIVNPWNSSYEVEIDRNLFYIDSYVNYCDLSAKDISNKYII